MNNWKTSAATLFKKADVVNRMLTEQDDRNAERRQVYLRAMPFADALTRRTDVGAKTAEVEDKGTGEKSPEPDKRMIGREKKEQTQTKKAMVMQMIQAYNTKHTSQAPQVKNAAHILTDEPIKEVYPVQPTRSKTVMYKNGLFYHADTTNGTVATTPYQQTPKNPPVPIAKPITKKAGIFSMFKRPPAKAMIPELSTKAETAMALMEGYNKQHALAKKILKARGVSEAVAHGTGPITKTSTVANPFRAAGNLKAFAKTQSDIGKVLVAKGKPALKELFKSLSASRKADLLLKKGGVIPGGMADKAHKTLKDFDPKQIAMGVKVEKEHTNSKAKQKEIAMDHLTEFPKYYTELAKMENKMKGQMKKKAEMSGIYRDGTAGAHVKHFSDFKNLFNTADKDMTQYMHTVHKTAGVTPDEHSGPSLAIFTEGGAESARPFTSKIAKKYPSPPHPYGEQKN